MRVDFDQIKWTTDIVRVVESYGIALKRSGRNYVGVCPFHDDHHLSLRVTPAKGLFRCPSCQATGNVIQFVAKKEGISEREAALKLDCATPGVTIAAPVAAPPAKAALVEPKKELKPGEAAALLQRVVSFYAKTLHKDRAGLDYLKSRKLDDPTMLEVFQVGYCNGTLPGVLPKSGELVDGLKALGVLNGAGREHFHGFITVPVFSSCLDGNVCGLYGRRAGEGETNHLYLPGPHRGVWNGACAKTNPTLMVVEAILDGMSLWQAGFKNVIALYGTGGWTADHEKLLREQGTTEVYLCLDNDDAGRAATERLKGKLLAQGHHALVKQIHVVQWPEGVKDANDFFLSRDRAGQADFQALLKAANPQGGALTQDGGPEAPSGAGAPCIEMTPEGFVARYAGRQYDVRAIEKPSASRLKATIRAVGEQGGGRCGSHFVIDTVLSLIHI